MSQTQDKNALFTDAAAAPAEPLITTIVDAAGPLAGYVPPDGLASDAQPTVMGTGVAGNIISLFDNNVLLGTVLVNATGRWSFQPQTPLSGGKHELTATQSDGVNTSAVAESYPFSVAQIMVTGVTASDGTAIANGGTAHGTVTLTGWIADANVDPSTIAFYVTGPNAPNASVLFSKVTLTGHTFTAVMAQDSTVSAIDSTTLTNGTYHIDARATTESGRVITVSDPRMGFNVTETWSDASVPAVSAVHTDAAALSTAAAISHTVDLSADPASFFKSASAHIGGSADGVHTLHLTGDHGMLDLTSLSGKTAAAKVSGIDSINLGGAHNALKLSLTDVLNLGQPDLFQHDGKQQMVVQGSNGDSVDLSNAHIAGVADGHWQQSGATQVGGVTYNVYEHSGAHAELLVQQGVQIALHG